MASSSDNIDNTICLKKFNITIISAENLPNVRNHFKTRAYAEVLIGSSNQTIKGRTPSDNKNGLNPAWNHSMTYEITENVEHYDGLNVVIKLYTGHSLGRRYIGEVHTSMRSLYDDIAEGGGNGTLSVPVTQGTVMTDGILNFRYSFGQKYTAKKSDFMEKVIKFGVVVTMQVAVPIFIAILQI